ncbi:MAG: hypothetical protein EPN25_13630 [Nitrospirae bacterium]|nr:MAG: hypothetical protein EPN25_13630 [Nitrospirota bacterium]
MKRMLCIIYLAVMISGLPAGVVYGSEADGLFDLWVRGKLTNPENQGLANYDVRWGTAGVNYFTKGQWQMLPGMPDRCKGSDDMAYRGNATAIEPGRTDANGNYSFGFKFLLVPGSDCEKLFEQTPIDRSYFNSMVRFEPRAASASPLTFTPK